MHRLSKRYPLLILSLMMTLSLLGAAYLSPFCYLFGAILMSLCVAYSFWRSRTNAQRKVPLYQGVLSGLWLLSALIHLQPTFLHPLEAVPQKPQPLEGVIESVRWSATERGDKLSCLVKVTQGSIQGRVLIHGSMDPTEVFSNVQPGAQLVAQVVWQPAQLPSLPGGFDAHHYARSQGVVAVGRLRKIEGIFRSSGYHPLYSIKRFFFALQHHATAALTPYFDADTQAVLAAMGWGDRSRLTPALQKRFRQSGLAHVLVVSGAHVALMLSLLGWLSRKLPGSLIFKSLFTLLIITAYAALCQWEPAVTRAWGMVLLKLIAKCIRRPLSGLQALGFSYTFSLLIWPHRLFHLGFLMSTLVTLVLQVHFQPLFLARHDPKIPWERPSVLKNLALKLREAISLIFLCQVAIAPFLAYQTARLDWRAPFIQLVLTPLASCLPLFVIVGLLLSGLLGAFAWSFVAIPLRFLSGLLLEQLLPQSAVSVQNTFLFHRAQLPYWLLLLGVILLYAARRNRGGAKRYLKGLLATASAIAIGLWLFQKLMTPALVLYQMDVGQGDCQLLITPNAAILVDAGPPQMGPELGKALDALGLSKVNAFYLTHAHADHFGGAKTLIEEGRIQQVILAGYDPPDLPLPANRSKDYPNFLDQLVTHRVRVSRVYSGMIQSLSPKVKLRILHPQRLRTARDENQNSLVLEVLTPDGGILLTGDAEEPVEKQILDQLTPGLALKVGHHGSRQATSEAFLDRLTPPFALISVGKRNTYGHPTPRVLQSLKNHQIPVWRTDQVGTLYVSWHARGILIQPARGRKTWLEKPYRQGLPIAKTAFAKSKRIASIPFIF